MGGGLVPGAPRQGAGEEPACAGKTGEDTSGASRGNIVGAPAVAASEPGAGRKWEWEGESYPKRSDFCAARRESYVRCLEQGMNFTQAALAVGVSKRTGKVWRNGRTRSSGRNEAPSVIWPPKKD